MVEQPRKRLQRFEQFVHLHELTFSCYQRRSLLTDGARLKILARSLETACVAERFQLFAFVFMPEHVHMLVLPEDADARVSRFLARSKQSTSRQIRESLEIQNDPLLRELTVQERPGKTCFRFWQEGAGFDRNLYFAQAISASIDYLHTNPVKRRLCHSATEFKWSSARFYFQHVVDPDLPVLTRLKPEWFDTAGRLYPHS